MGTRADFYVGTGPTAEWVGSIGYDGYPDNKALHRIFRAKTEKAFRAEVINLIENDGGTTPNADKSNWPWPWKDSRLTDYAYAFNTKTKKVYGSNFGNRLAAILRKVKGRNEVRTELPYSEGGMYHQYGIDPNLPPESEAPCRWPNFDTKNFIRPGEKGSGVMLIGPGGVKGG